MDLGRERSHQVSVPPGFDGTLNLIPVQQKAEVLFFRHIQHQAHIIPICRHIEPGQSWGRSRERKQLILYSHFLHTQALATLTN
jgi:hypothetical protein